MIIRFHKKFEKQFKKLQPREKEQVKAAIKVFKNDPFHPLLHNHSLTGRLLGIRAFSAAHDLRILFREEGCYELVEMIKVGSHSQVY